MAISDEEAVAWAEERQGDERNPPPGEEQVEPPAATPAPAPTNVPAHRELTVVLTLLPGEGHDAPLRACYSVGAQGAPYPVISTCAVAAVAEAAAQIPARIAEAEARWLAQPNLPRAKAGAVVTRPAPATTTKPATGKSAAAVKGKAKGKEGSTGDDAARLAAALLRDTTAAVGTAPPAPTAVAIAATPGAPTPPIDPQTPPPSLPTKLPAPAAKGDQLSLFG